MPIPDEVNTSETPTSLEPTQQQLRRLSDTLASREPTILPFEGIPDGVDLANMTDYTAPISYDESKAPSATLRTEDGRVILLTTFRNPDSNQITSQHIQMQRPSSDPEEHEPTTIKSYTVSPITTGEFEIKDDAGKLINGFDVNDLQKLIDSSATFNPFGR